MKCETKKSTPDYCSPQEKLLPKDVVLCTFPWSYIVFGVTFPWFYTVFAAKMHITAFAMSRKISEQSFTSPHLKTRQIDTQKTVT